MSSLEDPIHTDEAPLLRSRANTADISRSRPQGSRIAEWYESRSRDMLALTTVLLLLGIGLGMWVYGTLPTSDRDEHPHEYALSTDRIRDHLAQFLDIANKHNSSRSVTNGHAASAEYVVSQLKAHGDCDIYKQSFMSPVWTVHKAPRLSVKAPVQIDYLHETDFQVMRYGGQGATIEGARVAVVGDGCVVDRVGDVDGKIAVARPSAGCSLFEAAFMLEQKGASAVVFVRSARFKAPSTAR
ncbi:hypothetical protein IWW39_005949, partial [Coemansia spiralis]